MTSRPQFYALLSLAAFALSGGCAQQKSEPRIGYEEARKMFESRGVQPSQPLPALSLVDLQGRPASIKEVKPGRPLVLVTASLTCNVARRHQPEINAMQKQLGDAATVVVIYTIDAHPKGDACPYTGKEWVPADNERDNVLVRQPVSLDDRLALARDYKKRYAADVNVFVDTMDNASWKALGEAPNLGLLVDRTGVVKLRQGWFDRPAMEKAVESLAANSTAH